MGIGETSRCTLSEAINNANAANNTAPVNPPRVLTLPVPKLYDGMGDAARWLPAVYFVRAVRT